MRTARRPISLTSRAFLAFIVAAGGAGLFNEVGCSRSPSRAPFLKTGEGGAQEMGLSLAAWIGRAILDKVVDEAVYAIRREEVKNDLHLLESALSRADASLSARIAALRKQVEEKASAQDIRKVVDDVVTELEAKQSVVGSEVAVTEERVTDLLKIIGVVSTVTPSPLLRVNLKGEPEVHPLMVKWAKLLSRSRTHFIEMGQLNRIYKPDAPEMQKAMETYLGLVKEIEELRQEMKKELARLLLERARLLETRRITHPDIPNFDASIASLTWLVKIAQIEEDGRYKGLLVVPDALIGSAASDILAAFVLSGADAKAVVPLYRKLIPGMPYDERDDLMPLVSKETQQVQASYAPLMETANDYHRQARGIQAELRLLVWKRSDLDPAVQERQKKKVALLKQILETNARAEALLDEAILAYLEQMKTLRPDNAHQKRFVRRIILPLSELCERSRCFDPKNTKSMEETWVAFSTPGKYSGKTDLFILYYRQRLKAGKTLEQMNTESVAVDLGKVRFLRHVMLEGTYYDLSEQQKKDYEEAFSEIKKSERLAACVAEALTKGFHRAHLQLLGDMGAICQNAVALLKEANSGYPDGARGRAIYRIDGSVDDVLQVLMRSNALEDKEILRDVSPDDIVPILLERLYRTEDEKEKVAIMSVFGMLGSAANAILPIIEDYLADPDPSMREVAADALRKIRTSIPPSH